MPGLDFPVIILILHHQGLRITTKAACYKTSRQANRTQIIRPSYFLFRIIKFYPLFSVSSFGIQIYICLTLKTQ